MVLTSILTIYLISKIPLLLVNTEVFWFLRFYLSCFVESVPSSDFTQILRSEIRLRLTLLLCQLYSAVLWHFSMRIIMGTLTGGEHVCGLRCDLRSSVEPHPFSPSCIQGITHDTVHTRYRSHTWYMIQLLYLVVKIKDTPMLPSRECQNLSLDLTPRPSQTSLGIHGKN